MNQASGDRQILSKALNISPSQQNYITNSTAGEEMCIRDSFDALRHGLILHPADVVAQIPAGITEGKSKHPRNADHVFRLAALTNI